MLFTAYCLSYGNWTVIPKQWRESFQDMKQCGFDAVALSYSESDHRYARRAFEQQVNMAHQCGLKVMVVPSRLLSRFAGAPLMTGYWISQHPEFQVPYNSPLACLECQEVTDWANTFISELVSDYPIDGIIWDEPKGVGVISHHPETIKRYGTSPTKEQMMDSAVELLNTLNKTALALRPDLSITIFNMPSTPAYYSQKAGALPEIEYCGFDGSCSKQSYFHESPEKFKPSVCETWTRTLNECKLTGKKTFALIENMLMPKGVENEFVEELSKFLSMATPDHLACYYYAHGNECPETVHRITIDTINKFISPANNNSIKYECLAT